MAAGVSLLSDLPSSSSSSSSLPPPSGACRAEISRDMETADTRVPTAKYTKVGETLRHVIPGHMQCSMACGGKACKYENPSRWSEPEQAVKGLYSSWITDNLLAMARPSTDIIEKYNIIDQFKRCGLKTVINLQRPGEHSSCGNPLEQESGFTYRPEVFMEAGVYFYNFGWKDYGVASLTTILDMVKVMSFAIQEGKMAVHCHAGLGRTGVLLACYLVFTSRMSADQAILFVRAKRPNSIQTRGQLLCVREFAQFLVPLRTVFACAEPRAHAVTLSQYLTRQRHLLHGYEARQMKHVPKVVQLVCGLLLDIAANRQVLVEDEVLEIPDLTAEVEKTVSQQALQQLGNEMRGKGIPVVPSPRPPSCPLDPPEPPEPRSGRPPHDRPLTSDNELEPLWRRQTAVEPAVEPASLKPPPSVRKSLSYSDSALNTLGPGRSHAGHHPPLGDAPPVARRLNRHYLSQDSLAAGLPPGRPDLPPFRDTVVGTAQDPPSGRVGLRRSRQGNQEDTGDLFFQSQKWLNKDWRSLSTVRSEESRDGQQQLTATRSLFSVAAESEAPGGGVARSAGGGGLDGGNETEEVLNEIPFIWLQAELSPEARRLLVARALAMDLDDQDLGHNVSVWQTELNSREGAWERMCLERNPLVLSGLMWSWLEQLKEPVISSEDMQALSEKDYNPQHALDSLEKGHRLTLLCILDCAARLLTAPGEVEDAFLNQTIQVFTKIHTASENSRSLYRTLKAILTPVLHEMRENAAAGDGEDSSSS